MQVLCKSKVAGKTSKGKEKASFEVEILGLEKQLSVLVIVVYLCS